MVRSAIALPGIGHSQGDFITEGPDVKSPSGRGHNSVTGMHKVLEYQRFGGIAAGDEDLFSNAKEGGGGKTTDGDAILLSCMGEIKH